MTKYGDRRDYHKIDVYLKRPNDQMLYICSTTWARNLRIAREMAALAYGHAASDLIASYSD